MGHIAYLDNNLKEPKTDHSKHREQNQVDYCLNMLFLYTNLLPYHQLFHEYFIMFHHIVQAS